MSGEFNGLRALILKDNVSAFYVHCFAHQLQLVMAIATKNSAIWRLFEMVGSLTIVICASCKKQDKLRESQKEYVENNLVTTGSGLNQELSLSRAGNTRWSSHGKTLSRLITLYTPVMEVLLYIKNSTHATLNSSQEDGLLMEMKKYEFVFYLHLMLHILDMTNTLSQCLQRKDQDLLNAVSLVSTTKNQLTKFRLEGFDKFIELANRFCDKHELEVVNMDGEYVDLRMPRKKANITLRHYYKVECFNVVLDMQIQELGNCFNEATSELLVYIHSLSPCDNFGTFNVTKLLRLAEMYPHDFDDEEKRRLLVELENYIDNVKADTRFAKLNGLSSLVQMMVQTKKHLNFILVYRLLKLALTLPVANTTVERSFSAMKFMKNDLRNRMGDEKLNDSCIALIEKDLLRNVEIEDVIDRFQK